MAKTETITTYTAVAKLQDAGGAYAISFYRPSQSVAGVNSNAVTVDGIPIESGNTLSIRQNVGDEDHHQYDIVFPSGGAGENILYIIRIVPKCS